MSEVIKAKVRKTEDKKLLVNRLNRIEGQVKGIRKMIENDAYCTDVMIQVSAVNAALNSFNKVLMSDHIRNCVSEDIKSDNYDSVEEFIALLQKLMK